LNPVPVGANDVRQDATSARAAPPITEAAEAVLKFAPMKLFAPIVVTELFQISIAEPVPLLVKFPPKIRKLSVETDAVDVMSAPACVPVKLQYAIWREPALCWIVLETLAPMILTAPPFWINAPPVRDRSS
jgi:hypothetical protein